MKSFPLLVILVILYGCTALQQPGVAPPNTGLGDSRIMGTEGPLPRTFQLHDVPHNPRKQKGTDCGPDSLRMVLNYRGKDVGEADITRKLTSRGPGGGTSFNQMQEIAVKFYKLPSFIIPNCDLDSLKSAIVNRWPPIIGYRASGRYYHAVVAVGYDDEDRTMLVHDPNLLKVRKIRYFDLGGRSEGSAQRLSCLLILPEGSTEEDLRRGLERFIPKELSSQLIISSMIPPQEEPSEVE